MPVVNLSCSSNAQQELPVAKIREAFLAREEAPSDILLHLGSGFPSETTRVAELDHFRDKVIVFHARSVDLGVTTSNMTDGSTKDSTFNDIPDGTSSNTMYSPSDGTKISSTHNGMSNGTSGNTTNSSTNSVPDGMSNKSTYNRTYGTTGSSMKNSLFESTSGNSTNGSTNISTNGSTNTSTNSSTNTSTNGSTDNTMGNSLSSVTPAHSSSSSRPRFAPEQTPLRQSSVASRASIDHSAVSYPAPSARMSSSSGKPGYATSPMSSLQRTAPAPATPLSASSLGHAALPGAQRQSPASNTPTHYAQAPVHPFVKYEPVPVPTRHYTPYAPAPHTYNPRASQAGPSPQGLFFGASNYPAQYPQPNGNGHVQTTDQSANTHTVSSHFHVLSPKSDASAS